MDTYTNPNNTTTKHLEVTMNNYKIKFERFENVIEILPSIYWYKQSFRQRFGKGVIVFAWLKWGLVIYKNNEQ